MRLSSAEHLAKELKPTFVYVFKVRKDGQFVDAYLIHMLDEPLAKVLKRLRKEQAKGTGTAINQKSLTMREGQFGERLEPNGQALRSALEKNYADAIFTNTSKIRRLNCNALDSNRAHTKGK